MTSIVLPLPGSPSFMAHYFLKDIEQITQRQVLATLIVVTGVILIAWEKS